ncbi:MAG: hypothetical protein A3J46_06135 [Candidatus Yanofskybacteria bacterium RIFCSPHIGHO2_02_FULL_41_11]|uniref:Hydrolase TatD n=1 Tax=Candidatus Yanofskybacteria bacterium RIFCSPHIGHO2_02_FULL_41_11 TaxID=1802675 RepID=A0A1F8F7D9_9BACT|nr:MAG: hypothetical protein A3J46_06135 [Candidatus Yanofskybacteria bacterium RIFCSPHIGHO2_02_FULL_41_11]
MIFDSHCHLQFPQYKNDREEMIKRTLDGGVFMICVGTDLETSKQGIELAQKYDGVWATVGLHPNDVFNEDSTISSYDEIVESSKVVAIGEVGLDYYRTTETQKQKKQKEVFEQFIDLAQKTKKPMVLHFRDSPKGSSGRVHKDALEILALSFKPKALSQTGVSHSFTGNIDEAKKYLDLGLCLGFNGIITFARQYDDVVRYVPLDRILLETDAPYLAPELYRGKRNEPLYVKEVAQKVAELKNEPLEKIIEQTTLNCKKLFSIN